MGGCARDATVLIDGGRISYAGPAASAPTTRSAATVLPGLWDCHGHLIGSQALDLARLPQEPTPLRAARSARDLTNALNAGSQRCLQQAGPSQVVGLSDLPLSAVIGQSELWGNRSA